MYLDFQTANNLLAEKLQSNQPFSCLRVDNTSGYVIDCVIKQTKPLDSIFNASSLLEGGIYPNDVDFAINGIMSKTFHIMEKADILGFVDISNEIRNGPLSKHFDKPMFFNPDFYVMDPGALLGYAEKHFGIKKPTIPWTHYLKGKKVLVISTHADSIKQQWKQIDKVWGENKDLIVPYELVDVIRSPYHPSMDSRQPPNCNNWFDSVEYIKTLIDNYDYDVLLAGCSSSAPFYVDHAKSRGKVGIQTGGVIQLHFGVFGYRWTKVPGHSEWHKMFNEHWIYPLQSDEADQRSNHPHLETNFAYWRT